MEICRDRKFSGLPQGGQTESWLKQWHTLRLCRIQFKTKPQHPERIRSLNTLVRGLKMNPLVVFFPQMPPKPPLNNFHVEKVWYVCVDHMSNGGKTKKYKKLTILFNVAHGMVR